MTCTMFAAEMNLELTAARAELSRATAAGDDDHAGVAAARLADLTDLARRQGVDFSNLMLLDA
jgi:hypothetical protein